MPTTEQRPPVFDFRGHAAASAERYRQIRPLCEEFSRAVRSILQETLSSAHIKVAAIEARAKDIDKFEAKAASHSDTDPNAPKYPNPISDIKDLTGVRVIVFLPNAIDDVDDVIDNQFTVIERSDKSAVLRQEGRFGYQSIHYLVMLKPSRADLPEYERFRGLIAEIQVRTILQHAWAEIEHDIQYGSVETIPSSLRRRFMQLAGMLEIADREFQAIQDEDTQLRQAARTSVREGDLESVEITADSIRAYLDSKLGADGRIALWSYEWTAEMLLKLGFKDLSQVDNCVAPYEGYELGRIRWGTHQGQLTEFELRLLAGMGEYFVKTHPWSSVEWFANSQRLALERFRKSDVPIGEYRPPS